MAKGTTYVVLTLSSKKPINFDKKNINFFFFMVENKFIVFLTIKLDVLGFGSTKWDSLIV